MEEQIDPLISGEYGWSKLKTGLNIFTQFSIWHFSQIKFPSELPNSLIMIVLNDMKSQLL